MKSKGKKKGRGSFDESKDLVVKSYPLINGADGTLIVAEACSYNGGPVKLQLVRIRHRRRGKLGRITNKEAGELIPVLSQFDLDFRSGHLDAERVARKAAAQQDDLEDEKKAAAAKAKRDADAPMWELELSRRLGDDA